MAELDVVRQRAGSSKTRQLIEVLGPPIIWGIRIAASYLLVPYACWWWGVWSLHFVTIVALVLTAGIGLLSYRDLMSTRGEVGLESESGRPGFMALLGLLSSGFFFVVMVAEGLANVFIDPCLQSGMPLPWR